MRKSTKILAAAGLLVAGLAAAPALYAHDSGGSMLGQGMMGMMGEMTEMMAGCSEMMQSMRQGGSGAPNEQWPHDTPAQAPSNG